MFFKSTLLPPHPVRWVKFHCWSSEFCDLTKVTHEARPPASGSEHLVSHPGLRRPQKADPTLQTPVNNPKTVFVPPPPTRTLRSNSSQSPPRSSPLHRPQEAPRQPRDGPGSVGEGNRESACPEGSIGPRLTWESRNSTTTFSLLHRAAISHPRVVPALKPAFPNSGSPTQPAREPSHATPPSPPDCTPLAIPHIGSAPSSRFLQWRHCVYRNRHAPSTSVTRLGVTPAPLNC